MESCCGDDDDYYSDDEVPPDFAGFIFFYCWMAGITLVAFVFYAYNNKLYPRGDVVEFLPEGNYVSIHVLVIVTILFSHFLHFDAQLMEKAQQFAGHKLDIMLILQPYYCILAAA